VRERRLGETPRKTDGWVLDPRALSQKVSGAKRNSKNRLNPTMIAIILSDKLRF